MKFLLILLITCFCSVVSSAQNMAIGVNYSLRYFPLESLNYSTDEGQYKLNLPENVMKVVFRARSNFHKKTVFFVSPTFTYGKYNYVEKGSNSWGEGGMGGSSGSITCYRSTARYEYCFLGLEFGLYHVFDLSSKFSLGLGISASVNSLISETTYRKERNWTSTYGTTIYSGPNAGTYSSTESGKNDNVGNLHTSATNKKIDVPFSMQWNYEKTALQVILSSGISSKSRDAVNTSKVNFFVSPQVAYFIKLGKPKTNTTVPKPTTPQ